MVSPGAPDSKHSDTKCSHHRRAEGLQPLSPTPPLTYSPTNLPTYSPTNLLTTNVPGALMYSLLTYWVLLTYSLLTYQGRSCTRY